MGRWGYAPFCPPFFPWFEFETRAARITLLDQLAAGTPERDWRVPDLGGDGIGWPARCEAPWAPAAPCQPRAAGTNPTKPIPRRIIARLGAASGSQCHCQLPPASARSQITSWRIPSFSKQQHIDSAGARATLLSADITTWLPLLLLVPEPACDGSTPTRRHIKTRKRGAPRSLSRSGRM